VIQKILCPTDLTALSKHGLSYAFSLARRNTAELVVFHAISFPRLWQVSCELDAYYNWEQIVSKLNIDRLLMEGERRLKGFICKNVSLETIDVPWRSKVVLLGRLAEEIVTAALQEEVDLIVMERRQRSLLARIFMEGTIERVSRAAPCPVLSVDTSKSRVGSERWPLPALKQLPSY
jgi:nucleotide-binding universal stress UspA family protein